MQIDYPEHLREHRHAIPARPDGANMIVIHWRPVPGVVGVGLMYEVVETDDLDGLIRLAPLTPGDERQPFWASPGQVVEVPGAYMDDAGYVRIPSNAADA